MNITNPINIIPVQAAANFTSAAISSHKLIWCSCQITSTGSGAGTLQLQASNDPIVNLSTTPQNWSNIGTPAVVSGAGAFMIPQFQICYTWVRAVYTNTGSGTISAQFFAQGD